MGARESTTSCTEALHYAGCAYPVEGLGPGRRVVAWVRGCTRACPGCMATDLWERGDTTAVEHVADELRVALQGLDGLTISGGEPFDQAEAVSALLSLLEDSCAPEVTVYTGYLLSELKAIGGACARLLRQIDILIDGPYMEHESNELIWRGSDNQQVRLLSGRARRYADVVCNAWPPNRPLHVQSLRGNRYRLVGIPRRGDLAAYRTALAARGLEVCADDDKR